MFENLIKNLFHAKVSRFPSVLIFVSTDCTAIRYAISAFLRFWIKYEAKMWNWWRRMNFQIFRIATEATSFHIRVWRIAISNTSVPASGPFSQQLCSCKVGLAKGDGETPPSVRPFSPSRWTRGKKVPYLFTDSAGVKNVRKRELRRVSSYDRKGKSCMQFDSPPTNVPLDIRSIPAPFFLRRSFLDPSQNGKLIFGGVERCVGFFSFKLAFYSWR